MTFCVKLVQGKAVKLDGIVACLVLGAITDQLRERLIETIIFNIKVKIL